MMMHRLLRKNGALVVIYGSSSHHHIIFVVHFLIINHKQLCLFLFMIIDNVKKSKSTSRILLFRLVAAECIAELV
jgi:hypothetical protein